VSDDAWTSASDAGTRIAAATPCRTCADERTHGWRQPARGRHRREPGQAAAEDPLGAEAVAQRPARQRQRREGERVAVDDPLQAGDRHAEVGPQ
jgi:hypothetical protein